MRIVSLLPGATEIICAIGLQDNLVGVTHECDWPPSVRQLPKVTRTLIPAGAGSAEIDALVRERLQSRNALYTLNREVLESLRPDLIVTQALCEVCAVAEAEVRAAASALPGRPRVLNLAPSSLEDVYAAMLQTGRAAGCEMQAGRAAAAMQSRVRAVEQRTVQLPPEARPRTVLLEWIDPLFCAGHWTPSLIERAGGKCVLGAAGQPSRTTSWQELCEAEPEALFAACCGYTTERALQDIPLLQRIAGWEALPCVQNMRVYFADGSAYFNRPGPRLAESLEILAHALHPSLHPLPEGLEAAVCPFA